MAILSSLCLQLTNSLNFPSFHPFVNLGFVGASLSMKQPGLFYNKENHSLFSFLTFNVILQKNDVIGEPNYSKFIRIHLFLP